jgi:rRNA maturation endonuclease Nob1
LQNLMRLDHQTHQARVRLCRRTIGLADHEFCSICGATSKPPTSRLPPMCDTGRIKLIIRRNGR